MTARIRRLTVVATTLAVAATAACGTDSSSHLVSSSSTPPPTIRNVPLTAPGTVLKIGQPAGLDVHRDGKMFRIEIKVTSIRKANRADFAKVTGDAMQKVADVYYVRGFLTPADSRNTGSMEYGITPSFSATTSSGNETPLFQVLGAFTACPATLTPAPGGFTSCNMEATTQPGETIASLELIGIDNSTSIPGRPGITWTNS